MTVLPVINCETYEEAEKKIRQAAEFSDFLHLDVEDGVFLPRHNWGDPDQLVKIHKAIGKPDLKFEVHLMVSNPEAVVDAWLRTGIVERVIVHLEAMTDSVYLLEKCKKYFSEAMLAVNPGTEAERLTAHKDDFKYLQVLAVQPGPSGQKFNEAMLDKIKLIRKNVPNAIIEVDGGVNLETAKLIKEAGADIVVSDSYIFTSPDPKRAYEELLKATSS